MHFLYDNGCIAYTIVDSSDSKLGQTFGRQVAGGETEVNFHDAARRGSAEPLGEDSE